MVKKKSSKNSYVLWRPDFRDLNNLPDTKVIRTDFLLNFIAIAAAIGLGFLLVFKEYNSYTLNNALAGLEEQIENNTATNNRILKMSRQFRKSELVLNEVVSFSEKPVLFSDLLVYLAEIRPESITIESVTIRPLAIKQGKKKTVEYRLTLNGTLSDQASPSPTRVITDYQKELSKGELIAPYFNSIALSSFIRDNENNIFKFAVDVSLNLKPEEQK